SAQVAGECPHCSRSPPRDNISVCRKIWLLGTSWSLPCAQEGPDLPAPERLFRYADNGEGNLERLSWHWRLPRHPWCPFVLPRARYNRSDIAHPLRPARSEICSQQPGTLQSPSLAHSVSRARGQC